MEYILVYPDRSLKTEFIQRYIDRGSPETFVKMMEDKWDVFIDSCVIPSNRNSASDYVLKSGEGLADVYAREMEHIEELKRKLKEEFSKSRGGHFNEALHKAFGDTFADIKELDVNLKQDISILEEQIDSYRSAEIHGTESLSMNRQQLSAFKTYAKQTYGIDIEDNISGMESFMEKLRDAIKKVKGALKGASNKQEMMQVKRYITDCDKAIKLYGSDTWLADQTFKDGGECTIGRVPVGLDKVRSISDLSRVINPMVSELETISKGMEKDARAKLIAGLKIWNRYKNSKGDVDTVSSEIAQAIDGLKFPPETKFDKDKFIGSLNQTSGERIRVPVLDKAGVKDAVSVLSNMCRQWIIISERSSDVAEDGVWWDDVYDIDIYCKMSEENKRALSDLMNLVGWENIILPMTNLETEYERLLLPVAQMLESWILYSVE